MARVDRFRRAEEDLLEIADYISRDRPSAAVHWLDEIERTLSILAAHPQMGEDVTHLRPGMRRFSKGKYLLFFEPSPDGIVLVRVLHGSRRIEDLFD